MIRIPRKIRIFNVKRISKSLDDLLEDSVAFSIAWDEIGDDTVKQCFGFVARVRVVEVVRGPKKVTIFLYYGVVGKLEWDPNRYCSPETKSFMNYTSTLGREL